jgi:hypothetical protein
MLERGDQTDDAGQVTVVEGRINDALDEIAAFTSWNVFHARDTFNTQIGVAQYNMPAGLREIIQLRYTDNGEPLFMSTIQELARLGIKLEDSGRAQAWLEDGHLQSGSDNLYRIRLAPVPESVLTIEREYYYNPSDVASMSHLPVQDNLVVAIKHHVRSAMSVNDERFEEASYHRRSFEQILDRLLKQEQRKVASFTALRRVDLAKTRGWRGPQFDGSHYRN